MTTQSEKIIKDRQDRILGDKYYADKNLNFTAKFFGDNFYTTSYLDVSGGESTIYYEKITSILILLFAQVGTEFGSSTATLRLLIDNVEQTPTFSNFIGGDITATGHYVKELSEGNHTFKIQLKGSDIGELVYTIGNYTILNLSVR